MSFTELCGIPALDPTRYLVGARVKSSVQNRVSSAVWCDGWEEVWHAVVDPFRRVAWLHGICEESTRELN